MSPASLLPQAAGADVRFPIGRAGSPFQAERVPDSDALAGHLRRYRPSFSPEAETTMVKGIIYREGSIGIDIPYSSNTA